MIAAIDGNVGFLAVWDANHGRSRAGGHRPGFADQDVHGDGVHDVRDRALPDPRAASVGELTAAHRKVQPWWRAPDRAFDAVSLGPRASTT
jgi:hypothetical protein